MEVHSLVGPNRLSKHHKVFPTAINFNGMSKNKANKWKVNNIQEFSKT